MCQVVTQFGEMLLAQDLRFSLRRDGGHAAQFYNVRVVFAMAAGPEDQPAWLTEEAYTKQVQPQRTTPPASATLAGVGEAR